jgi:hypothetical protein
MALSMAGTLGKAYFKKYERPKLFEVFFQINCHKPYSVICSLFNIIL